MISEVTKWVIVTWMVISENNQVLEGSTMGEFGDIPTMNDIKAAIRQEADGIAPKYAGKWNRCVILNLQFLSKAAFEQLSQK